MVGDVVEGDGEMGGGLLVADGRVGRRQGAVLCSIHIEDKDCSTCLRCRRNRKMS